MPSFSFFLIQFVVAAICVSSSILRHGFVELDEKKSFQNLMDVHMLASTSNSKYKFLQYVALSINTFPDGQKYLGNKDPVVDFHDRVSIVKYFIEKAYNSPSTIKSNQVLKVSHSYDKFSHILIDQ